MTRPLDIRNIILGRLICISLTGAFFLLAGCQSDEAIPAKTEDQVAENQPSATASQPPVSSAANSSAPARVQVHDDTSAETTDAGSSSETPKPESAFLSNSQKSQQDFKSIMAQGHKRYGFENVPDGVVCLDLHDRPHSRIDLVQGSLFRELARQSLLVCAREELGLATRDGLLREELPWTSRHYRELIREPKTPWPLSVVVSVSKEYEAIVTVFKRSIPDRAIWEKTYTLSPAEPYCQLVSFLEADIRNDFVKILELEGFKGEPRPWLEQDDSLAEVESFLDEMNLFSQFAAVRRTHELMAESGESAARLIALSRGYAHLSLLSDQFFGPQHKVFKARALVYAERLIHKLNDHPRAYANRAYARAWVGLVAAGARDLETAMSLEGFDPPPWFSDLSRYTRGENAGQIEEPQNHQQASIYNRLLQFGRVNIDARRNTESLILEQHPENLYARIHTARGRSLGLKATALETLSLLPQVIPPQLLKNSSLPPEIRKRIESMATNDANELGEIAKMLKQAGRFGTDRGEPSWDLLGQLLQETTYIVAWQVLDYQKNWLSVPIEGTLVDLAPLYEEHPYAKAIQSLNQRGDQWNETGQALYESINPDTIEVKCLTPLYPLRRANFSDYTEINTVAWEHTDAILTELLRNLTGHRSDEPKANQYFDELMRVAPRHPATLEWQIALRPEELKDRLEELEVEFADDSSILKMISSAYSKLGKMERAEIAMRRCCEIDPSFDHYNELANLLEQKKDVPGWIEAKEQSLLQPVTGLEHARVRVRLANYYLWLNEPKKAEPYAEEAAGTYAAWALFKASEVKERLEKWEESEAYVSAASRRYEEQRDRWFRWVMRTGKGDFDAAGELANRWAHSHRESSSTEDRFSAAIIQMLTNESEAGNQLLYETARKTKDRVYLWYSFLFAEINGETELANEFLNQIAGWNPQSDYEARLAGTIPIAQHLKQLRAEGKASEVDLDQLDEWIANSSTDAPTCLWCVLGQYLALHGRTSEAIDYLENAASSPQEGWNRELAAYLLRNQNAELPPTRKTDFILPEKYRRTVPSIVLQQDLPADAVFLQENRRVVSTDSASMIRIWDAQTQKITDQIDGEGILTTLSTDWSRGSIMNDETSEVSMMELSPKLQPPVKFFKEPQWGVFGVQLLDKFPDRLLMQQSRYWASERPEPFVTLWDTKTRKQLWKREMKNIYFVMAIEDPANRSLILACRDVNIANDVSASFETIDIETGELRESKTIPRYPIGRITWPESDAGFVTVSDWGEVIVWNLALEPQIRFWRRNISSIDLSRDGSRLAVGSRFGRIILFDLTTKQLVAHNADHYRKINALVFSGDGKYLCTASDDTSIRIWNVEELIESSVPVIAGQRTYLPLENSIGMQLVPLYPRIFLMGEHDDYAVTTGYQQIALEEQQPRHQVELTKLHYLSQFEVTRGQFNKFVQATGYVTEAERDQTGAYHLFPPKGDYRLEPTYNWRNPGFEQTDEHPVVSVTWNDAQEFCRWLSQAENKTYRLPTEAEWEQACRGDMLGAWQTGYAKDSVKGRGNVAEASIKRLYDRYGTAARWDDGFPYSSPVGSYAPNPFGLYDMHGNVYEWCQDWFAPDYYKSSPSVDPQGPETGTDRVQRGGSFLHHYENSRSAHRDHGKPTEASSCVGFRVVLEIEAIEEVETQLRKTNTE